MVHIHINVDVFIINARVFIIHIQGEPHWYPILPYGTPNYATIYTFKQLKLGIYKHVKLLDMDNVEKTVSI